LIDFLSNFPYWNDLLAVATIAVFMVISPGADFAMITRNSLLSSRTSGLFSAFGVSCAIWIHLFYSIAGLVLIISQSPILFSFIKFIGAGYLIYIGYKTFNRRQLVDSVPDDNSIQMSKLAAFKNGFITNALNPKTSLFFFSIFTQVVDPHTPVMIQIVYGAIISFAHLAWFSLVACFFSHPILQSGYSKHQILFSRIVGSALIIFGLKVLV
jgi:RhtB (resistance to homoserine/threonine) family protein